MRADEAEAKEAAEWAGKEAAAVKGYLHRPEDCGRGGSSRCRAS